MAGQDLCDYLIVGQGLAGSLLAWQLERLGRRVLIVDDDHRGAASTAAAGLINPLAGLRFSRSPHVDRWLAAAHRLYAELEVRLGRPYYHSLPVVRLFRSPEQVRFWERLAADPAAARLLGERFAPGASGQPLPAPCGGFHQRATGYLDVAALLADLRAHFRDLGLYRAALLDYRELQPRPNDVQWRDVRAGQVIFCEGHRALQNPWFGALPFRGDGGEILGFTSRDRLPDRIVIGAHWLLPRAGGEYRVGATHDHDAVAANPTDAGRETLLAGLVELLGRRPELRLTSHLAGVRPGTADRAPLLGTHPNVPRLAVCNGFGARGSLTIPWYSACLVAHLETGAALPAEAAIARFAR